MILLFPNYIVWCFRRERRRTWIMAVRLQGIRWTSRTMECLVWQWETGSECSGISNTEFAPKSLTSWNSNIFGSDSNFFYIHCETFCGQISKLEHFMWRNSGAKRILFPLSSFLFPHPQPSWCVFHSVTPFYFLHLYCFHVNNIEFFTCAKTSNSFLLLSKLIRPSLTTSGMAVSIMVKSVKKVPR